MTGIHLEGCIYVPTQRKTWPSLPDRSQLGRHAAEDIPRIFVVIFESVETIPGTGALSTVR
jgi:hypothetical protein